MTNDPLKFPNQGDPAARIADVLGQRTFHQAAEQHINDELWRVIAGFIEKDARCAAPAMMAIVNNMVQVWLGLWHALNVLEPGSIERFDNLRTVIMKNLDLAREIISSKSPDTVAEMHGIVIAPSEKPNKPML